MPAFRSLLPVMFVLALSACVAPVGPAPSPVPAEVAAPVPITEAAIGTPREAAEAFVAAVDRVQPVAEAICRARTRGIPCTYRIAIDDRPGMPPNAFQTIDRAGRPVLGFSLALIAQARNIDEIAFVVGHEASHHILGHLPAQRQSAMAGAITAGVLASLGGADPAAIRAAQEIGAQAGARRYSKDFELEADALGAEIAFAAGFDPLLGAQYFRRLPDPGNRFLGSHPPNAARLETVRRTVAALEGRGN